MVRSRGGVAVVRVAVLMVLGATVLDACGGSTSVGPLGVTPAPPDHPPIRASVAGGCPRSVGRALDVTNPAFPPGDHLVPDSSARAGVVCVYTSTDPYPARSELAAPPPMAPRVAHLRARTAARLSAAVYRLSVARPPPDTATACPSGSLFPPVTIIVLAYADRPDVDLWWNRTACETLDDGHLTAMEVGQPAFYDRFVAAVAEDTGLPEGGN